MFQCSLFSLSDFRGGKALQSYGLILNWQNFSSTFFSEFFVFKIWSVLQIKIGLNCKIPLLNAFSTRLTQWSFRRCGASVPKSECKVRGFLRNRQTFWQLFFDYFSRRVVKSFISGGFMRGIFRAVLEGGGTGAASCDLSPRNRSGHRTKITFLLDKPILLLSPIFAQLRFARGRRAPLINIERRGAKKTEQRSSTRRGSAAHF
jgi:hypothetical protein